MAGDKCRRLWRSTAQAAHLLFAFRNDTALFRKAAELICVEGLKGAHQLLLHQQEMRTGQRVWERNEEMHDLIGAHELDRYLIKPESLLCNCVRADRVKHEMALRGIGRL